MLLPLLLNLDGTLQLRRPRQQSTPLHLQSRLFLYHLPFQGSSRHAIYL